MEDIADNSHLHHPKNWSSVWRLEPHPKVKNLIWRVCRGCLPMRARLLDRGVNCSSMCAMWDESYDDAIHVLFGCPRANNILSSKVSLTMQNKNTSAEIIFALLHDMSQIQVEQFVAILLSLWKSRNIHVWQNATEISYPWACEAVVEWLDNNEQHQVA